MAREDNFDRATFGSNWAVARRAIDSVETLDVIAGGGGLQPSAVEQSSGNVYIAEGAIDGNQWVQLTVLETVNFQDINVYNEDYGSFTLYMRTPQRSDNVGNMARFRLAPQMYYTSYDEIYWDIFITDAAGNTIAPSAFAYVDIATHFDSNSFPKGTKIRFEQIGNVYTGYVWSPDRGFWYPLGSVTNTGGISTGYPGLGCYASDSVDDAIIGEFKFDTAQGSFLGSLAASTSEEVARGLTRNLTREVATAVTEVRNANNGEAAAAAGFGPPSDFDSVTGVLLDDTNPTGDLYPIVSVIAGSFPNADGFAWNDDGTKLLVTSGRSDRVASFSCSTPWDVSTATEVGAQFGANNPASPIWLDDGNKFGILLFSDQIRIYSLAVAYTMQAAPTLIGSCTTANVLTGADGTDRAMCVSQDGQYIASFGVVAAAEQFGIATLSTPFDPSTFGSQTTIALAALGPPPVAGQLNHAFFNTDGSRIYFTDGATMSMFEMSTPYDASTVSYDSGNNFTLPITPTGLDLISTDRGGQRLWVSDRNITAGTRRCMFYDNS